MNTMDVNTKPLELLKPWRINVDSIVASTETHSEIAFSDAIMAHNCHFIRIDELGFDDKMPRREALENVIAAMNYPEFNFVYLLAGTERGIELYLGVTRNYEDHRSSKFHAYDFGELLRQSFTGNFHGSSVVDITTSDDLNRTILDRLSHSRRGSIITGIPSVNTKSEDKELYTQKLNSLANSMSGAFGHWQVLIVCDAMSNKEIERMKSALFGIYDRLHRESKLTIQESTGKNVGTSTSRSTGDSWTKTTGTNSSDSTTEEKQGHTKGISDSIAEGSTSSESTSETTGTNEGVATTIEHIRKEYQALLKYMDDELFERLKIGQVKGLFKTAIYALAENNLTHKRLVRNLCAMWQGDSSSFSPLRATELPVDTSGSLQKILAHFGSVEVQEEMGDQMHLVFGHPQHADKLELRTCLTSRELSLICALPSKELPGLPLRKAVDFGLNPASADREGTLELGSIIHQGQKLAGSSLTLDRAMLSRHVFVAGVTGSGKTTTCRRLLTESRLPFLIIEPAKTEYRSLLAEIDDLEIYTLGNEQLSPFRFNPFELLPGESITSHVDLLKAAFTAAFPMEAAMPYLLEEAIYKSYEEYGWNTDGWIEVSEANEHYPNPWAAHGVCWPTMKDLLKNLECVVKSKGFDTRLESDYIASLVARFKNLTVGAKGQMLNCKVSTDLTRLLDKPVVLELDDLKSPEDKCLMMGLIISRLAEAIKIRFIQEPSFQHISLIEEAHRLLERPAPGEEGPRKHAVGMFTDLLAEVRKYGESLVIVDQIPNKLAPEVLKNTNTKIIHKLFARDDRESIGDTAGLNDDQKAFLTDLRIGEVVAYSGNWKSAVHAQIAPLNSDDELSDHQLIEKVAQAGRRQQHHSIYCFAPELTIFKMMLDESELQDYLRFKRAFWNSLNRAKNHSESALKDRGSANRYFTLEWVNGMADALDLVSACHGKQKSYVDAVIGSVLLMIRRNKIDKDHNEFEEELRQLLSLSDQGEQSKRVVANNDLYKDIFDTIFF
ncbi:ATP-binding protein [Ferrimonas balearica]|uniref:ATP-binding protein n=1 Tax=Ferrimonas balearica TaxID=44012 RepID=UPI001F43CADA|nr:DUF87 domain-containing protein [Ferrimonas balearica]MBY6093960.1 DUF87 domain-containing protein [Ferrimonas balearica]